jgi:hypothetical protein
MKEIEKPRISDIGPSNPALSYPLSAAGAGKQLDHLKEALSNV